MPRLSLSFPGWHRRLAGAHAAQGDTLGRAMRQGSVLQPGLWLMRRLRARSKILALLSVFVLPLLALSAHTVLDARQTQRRSDAAMLGLHATLAMGQVGKVAYQRRLGLLDGSATPTSLPPIAAALDQAEAAMARLNQQGLATPAEWTQTLAAARTLTKADPSPAADEAKRWLAVLNQHIKARQEVLLLTHVLDSNDSDGPQLAQLSQQDLPEASFQLALTRTAATALAKARAEEPPDDARIARASGVLAMTAGRIEMLADRVDQGLARHPIGGKTMALALLRPALASARSAFLSPQTHFDIREFKAQLDGAMTELLGVRWAADAAFEQELAQQLAKTHLQVRLTVAGLVLAALVSGYLGLCYWLATLRGFERMQAHLTAMSEGDFSTRANINGSDEVADALVAINRSFASVAELLGSVQQSVSAINHAGAQIANGNAELTERNRRAMTGLQEVVSGVERYAQQLQACGQQVESVVGTVQQLRMGAASNRKQMARLQERMHELQGKSREIAEIVGLIDAISFRTNILALNASIEASKAGEAGRGFAVVAQEVRSLAMRSAESSRRIGDIVMRSTEDISLSGALADEAGRTLTESDVHVDRIHAAIEDVARLTRGGEQQSGEILAEVRRLNEDTGRNTALVEQLAQAGEALQGQGEVLVKRVDKFKLV